VKHPLGSAIADQSARLSVIGLGYVGLPLAVAMAAAGYQVTGIDVQQSKAAAVNNGENYIADVDPAKLKEAVSGGRLTATTDFAQIAHADIAIICVPTPLDQYKQPDLTYVTDAARSVAQYLHPGMLVILESTTYPGTTEEVLRPILEESGLTCGEDFHLAFSPERVDPGNPKYKTGNTPKVVGGVTPACTKLAAALYEQVLDAPIHPVSSPAVAEMEKILENTFRNINIALVNEMAILCSRMNIDIWEVIDAAATKPYGFMPFYPGPGLGGHCIPLDPAYLEWKAKKFNYHTKLIETAAAINDYMPEFVAENAMRLLNRGKKAMSASHILIMGMAYKGDIDDSRESPAFRVIEELEKYGAHIHVSDPYVQTGHYKGKTYTSIPWEEVIGHCDLTLITTAHSCVDYQAVLDKSKIIYDTRNALQGIADPEKKVTRL